MNCIIDTVFPLVASIRVQFLKSSRWCLALSNQQSQTSMYSDYYHRSERKKRKYSYEKLKAVIIWAFLIITWHNQFNSKNSCRLIICRLINCFSSKTNHFHLCLIDFMMPELECELIFVIQSIINLRLMMEVTKTGPLSAPILSRTVQKSHFLSTTFPVDCVIRTTFNETIKE